MSNITELTKEQKIAAYKYAVDYILNTDRPKYVCPILKQYVRSVLKIRALDSLWFSGETVKKLFPEFWAQKPEHVVFDYSGWWDIYLKEPRIEVLQNAIKLLED